MKSVEFDGTWLVSDWKKAIGVDGPFWDKWRKNNTSMQKCLIHSFH